MTESIHPETKIGTVVLMTSNLTRSVDFYQEVIGMRVRQRAGQVAVLGTTESELLVLQEKPGAKIAPRRTGLYHFDLVFPTRLTLAQSLHHLIETRTLITGFINQGFNEAIYLADPDGYGISLTCDRPKEMWSNFNGELAIKLNPLDVDGLLAERDGVSQEWTMLPEAARIGSVNLNVNDLDQSEAFYCKVLGFQHSAEMPGARFVKAGDYHHHICLNTWSGGRALPPPPEALQMIAFEIVLPDFSAFYAIQIRMEKANKPLKQWHSGWLTQDPSNNPILLRVK